MMAIPLAGVLNSTNATYRATGNMYATNQDRLALANTAGAQAEAAQATQARLQAEKDRRDQLQQDELQQSKERQAAADLQAKDKALEQQKLASQALVSGGAQTYFKAALPVYVASSSSSF